MKSLHLLTSLSQLPSRAEKWSNGEWQKQPQGKQSSSCWSSPSDRDLVDRKGRTPRIPSPRSKFIPVPSAVKIILYCYQLPVSLWPSEIGDSHSGGWSVRGLCGRDTPCSWQPGSGTHPSAEACPQAHTSLRQHPPLLLASDKDKADITPFVSNRGEGSVSAPLALGVCGEQAALQAHCCPSSHTLKTHNISALDPPLLLLAARRQLFPRDKLPFLCSPWPSCLPDCLILLFSHRNTWKALRPMLRPK